MRALILIALLLVVLIALTGCIKEPEVCNYDGICTEDETDECADCKNVLGRDVDSVPDANSPENSP